jgi:hypothetical protein
MQPRTKWVRRTTAAVAIVAGVLAFAGIAWADKEKIQLKPDAQAAARATLIKRADLGSVAGWTGGMEKPDYSSEMPCSNFHPKQSDLVLNGSASSNWDNPAGLQISSEAQVLATPAMVALDWQRTVLDPRVVPCLRTGLAKELPAGAKLVSFRRIAFPRISTHTAAFRALVDVKTPTATVRLLFDVLLFDHARTEITVTVTAPAASAAVIHDLELRLARLMIARATL